MNWKLLKQNLMGKSSAFFFNYNLYEIYDILREINEISKIEDLETKYRNDPDFNNWIQGIIEKYNIKINA